MDTRQEDRVPAGRRSPDDTSQPQAPVADVPGPARAVAPAGDQPGADGRAALPDPAAHRVLDLAMRVGDALLSAGMSANDVVVLMLRIARAYGLDRVHVDVTYTSICASFYPGAGAAPHTSVRVVQLDIVDYTRVRRLDKLCTEIAAGLPIDEAMARFGRITSAPRPYPGWLAMLGHAGVGPAVSLLFTTSWKVLLITFLTACLVDRLLVGLNRRGVPPFFRQFTAAALITFVAAAVAGADARGVAFFADVDPSLVVVGGIAMLVAGTMIVGAVQDAIDGFYVTASARVFEVVLRTAGIVAGIAVALRVVQEVGATLAISTRPMAHGPLVAQFVGVALTAAFFAIYSYADAVTVLLAAAMAMLGWLGVMVMSQTDAGVVLANAIGAVVAALIASLLVRRTSVPGFALISAALLPLFPGLMLYNGLLQLVGTVPDTADATAGVSTLFLAFWVAIGVAAGVSLGTSIGRPIGDRLRGIAFARAARARR
ncbi:MAG TPA: threonine/serine exporter family protein [Micromonosporaceae bacterium]